MNQTILEIEEQIKKLEKNLKGAIPDSSDEKSFRKQLEEKREQLQQQQRAIRPLIISRTFKTLEFVLQRSSEFFPNRKLFDEDLIYFPDEECQIMQKIQNMLTAGTEERMYLLYGNPASGKTVMGLSIAKELEKQGQGYTALYHNLTDKSDVEKLWAEMERYGDRKVLFILDDCHLNLQAATTVYQRFDNIQQAACLLLSRNIPKNLRLLDEFDYLDIFEKLAERSFELNTRNDEQVEKKMAGIMQRYQAYYERTHHRKFVIGDEKLVIQNVRRNFLTLYFYLSFWEETDQLDQLDEKRVLRMMYLRYLKDYEVPEKKADIEVFLKYAALYQYEIQFKPPSEDVASVLMLVRRGLLDYDFETGYYAFYHSDFAKLLVKAYAYRPVFAQEYHDIQDFTLQQIRTYLRSFEAYPPNLDEILRNLVVNEGIPLLRALLADADIAAQTIHFYHHTDSAYNLSRSLSLVSRYAPESLRTFAEPLTINHPHIKPLFVNAEGTLIAFVSILKILQDVNIDSRANFLELFVHEEQKRIILNSPFNVIGWQLNTLQKLDPKIARAFLNLVTVAELIEKAQQVSFEKLGNALNELKNIDAAKAQEVFEALDVNTLVTQAQQVSFEKLGNALNELKNIDAAKTQQVFDAFDVSGLVTQAQQVGFGRLGKALNELKNIDAAKTQAVFDALDVSGLVTQAQQVSFGRLGKVLSALSYVNIEKTRDILKHLDVELLASQACKEKYSTFLCDIPALARIDAAFTQQFLIKLPDEFLFQFDSLKNLFYFNNLFFAFHFAELCQHAEKLVHFAKENIEHFLKCKSLRSIASFLNLCSHYFDVKSIIRQYHHKFFRKIRFGEPSEIPYFLRVIYDHEPEIALEF
jgi:nitrate reductase NapAB chaperone NapD/ABC-type dipeptide/oligopeptide/nickel transport system ATPase component